MFSILNLTAGIFPLYVNVFNYSTNKHVHFCTCMQLFVPCRCVLFNFFVSFRSVHGLQADANARGNSDANKKKKKPSWSCKLFFSCSCLWIYS